MKAIKGTFNVFFAFLITIFIIANFVVHTILSTILKKDYITDLLGKNDYYEKVELELNNKLEEYEYQSGLPQEIFENLYTSDIVKADINSIIRCIYDGKELTNNAEAIRDRLVANIDEYLKNNNISLNKTEQNNVYEFENIVVEAYSDNMSLSEDTLKQIYNAKEKTHKICIFVQIGLVVLFIIILIIWIMINVRTINRFINMFMVSLLSSGVLLKLLLGLVYRYVDFEHIVLLKKFFSDFIREVVYGTFSNISTYSTIFIVVGIIGIISSNYYNVENMDKKKKA